MAMPTPTPTPRPRPPRPPRDGPAPVRLPPPPERPEQPPAAPRPGPLPTPIPHGIDNTRAAIIEARAKGEISVADAKARLAQLRRDEAVDRRLDKTRESLGLFTPLLGTYMTARSVADNWDQLSVPDKVSGLGWTALSAIGDAAIVGGPIIAYVKSLRGVPVLGYSAATGAEVGGLTRAAAAGGDRTNLVVKASTAPKDLAEVKAAVKSLGENPLQRVKVIEIEAPASSAGAKALVATDRAVLEAMESLSPATRAQLDKLTKGVLRAEQAGSMGDFAEIPQILKDAKVSRVTIREVRRPNVGADDAELRGLARTLAKGRKLGEDPDDIAQRLSESLGSRNPAETAAYADDLADALKGQDVAATKELEDITKLKDPAKARVREVVLEPPGPMARGGGGVATAAPPATGTGLTTSIRTPTGRPIPIAVSPLTPTLEFDVSEYPELAPKPLPTPTPGVPPAPGPVDRPSRRPTGEPSTPVDPDAAALTISRPLITPSPVPASATGPTTAPTTGAQPATQTEPAVKTETTTPAATATRRPTGTEARGALPLKLDRPITLGAVPMGRFPHTVTWEQGAVNVRHNLHTGKSTYTKRAVASRRGPSESLRVVAISRRRPPEGAYKRMGVVQFKATGRRVRFRGIPGRRA